MTDVTIAIPARNASATIARAVRSALTQGDSPILLIDDWSDDETVSIAQAAGGPRLSVVRPSEHRSLGFARHTGLVAVTTPYLVWLDADDELLPGRIERMRRAFLDDRADIVCDAVEMADGASGRLSHVAAIPAFFFRPSPLTRQFERNYLPGSAMIGVKVKFARTVDYDSSLLGAEDTDFLLRGAFLRPRVSLLQDVGYRMYTYSTSLSRNIDAQRAMVRRTLEKHSYDDVRSLFQETEYPARIADWAIVSMAIFREDYAQALAFIDAIDEDTADPAVVVEPDGPSPFPEAWRLAFQRGTLELLLDMDAPARVHLEMAERVRPTAEGANNLGVALSRTGDADGAGRAFAESLHRSAGFLDAKMNLDGCRPARITTHPLRTHRNRDDYVPANAGVDSGAPPLLG